MNRYLTIMLLLCLCLLPTGLAEAQGPLSGAISPVTLTATGEARILNIPSSSLTDAQWFQFTPSESAVYLVATQPSLQDIWVQLYPGPDSQHPIDGQTVWDEDTGDWGIAYQLTAGQDYFLQVGAFFGAAAGNLSLQPFPGTLEQNVPGQNVPESVLTGVESAVTLTDTDHRYPWSIENQLWDAAGNPIGEFQDEFYRLIPAETANYQIVSSPSEYDSYLTLYVTADHGELREVPELGIEVRRADGRWDFLIETELEAGREYFVRVSAMESGSGYLSISGGRLSPHAAATTEPQLPSAPTEPAQPSVIAKIGVSGYSHAGQTKELPACYRKGADIYVPVRLLQDLGARLQWDAAAKCSTLTLADRTARLTVGSNQATVNGDPTPVAGQAGTPLVIETTGGRVMAPLHFLCEQLGVDAVVQASGEISLSLR